MAYFIFKTLRASIEFSNIEIKAETRPSHRQLDIKILEAYANVVIVLSQNKNHLFNMECCLDQDSEFLLNTSREQVICN